MAAKYGYFIVTGTKVIDNKFELRSFGPYKHAHEAENKGSKEFPVGYAIDYRVTKKPVDYKKGGTDEM